MACIGEAVYEDALQKRGCHPMIFTSKPMKGFVYIDASSHWNEQELNEWITLCLQYNKVAPKSKKNSKKPKK